MKHVFQTFLLIFTLSNFTSAQITTGLLQNDPGTLLDGYVLFAPIGSTTTYLIDKCGKEVKTWPSIYRPGLSCYLLTDGSLLRTGNINNTSFIAGGKGGIIQKIDWNGTVTWSYTVSNTTECQHHDVRSLPNGNVLAIVWELKTNTEAIEQGRDPVLTSTSVWSEKIIEIQPVGATGGTIVWEWHLWDHLVQDFDITKPNYGAIDQNPQLLNLNFNASSNTKDWIHLNSIDYNPALDQILLSSHSFDEVWIIDHSTSTIEAASHTGGNSGKGGDILYRWGNPQAYGYMNSTQKLFGQHNAHWIENGLPYQDQIMIFNNGNGRTNGNYSTIEIINPPVDGFNYTPTLPYGPTTSSWIYNDGNTENIYAQNISGSQQLSNGNVLFCNGPSGLFVEINSTGETLWEYANPVGASITSQGTIAQNQSFRCVYYPSSYSGFIGKSLIATNPIENTNLNSDACILNVGLNDLLGNETAFQLFPNPTSNQLTIQFVKEFNSNVAFTISDQLGRIVFNTIALAQSSAISINVSRFQKGIYFVSFQFEGNSVTKKIVVE